MNESLDNNISACDFNSNSSSNPYELLNAVKPYLNNDEKNLVEMFINMVNAFNMYGTYKTLSNLDNSDIEGNNSPNIDVSVKNSTNTNSSNNNFNIDSLKSMLTPSQKAMFETYSSLLNNQNQ